MFPYVSIFFWAINSRIHGCFSGLAHHQELVQGLSQVIWHRHRLVAQGVLHSFGQDELTWQANIATSFSNLVEHRWTSLIVEPYRKIFAKTMAIPNDGTVFFSVFEGDPEIHRIGTEIHHYVPHGHLAWLESVRTSSLHIPSLSSHHWKEHL